MLFLAIFLFATMLGLLIVGALTGRLNRQLTDGTLISVRDYADLMIQLADFNQAHPRADLLNKRCARWYRLQSFVTVPAILLGLAWLTFLPDDLEPGFLWFIAVIGLFAAVAFGITVTSYYQVTKIYQAHQIQTIQLDPTVKKHRKAYFYALNSLTLLLCCELLGLEYFLFNLITV